MTPFLLGALVSALICLLLIPVLIYVVEKKKWQDQPNDRKEHRFPVPAMGGLAIFAAVVIAIICTAQWDMTITVLLGSTGVLVAVGWLDDRFDLSVRLRFGVQVLAGVLFYGIGWRIHTLHGLFGLSHLPPVVALLATVLFCVAVVNIYNLIDGIDGLAAGFGLLSLVALSALLYREGAFSWALVGACWSGALLGFLWFNFHPARLFMGDTGSIPTGLLIAAFSLKLLSGDAATTGIAPEAFVFGIIAIPLLDCARVFLSRIRLKKSPFQADRTHMHHLLTLAGLNHRQAVLILYAFNLLLLGLIFWLDAKHQGLKISITVIAYIVFIRMSKLFFKTNQVL